MKQTFCDFGVLLVVVGALLWLSGPSPSTSAAFAAGEALFAGDVALLAFIGARLFAAAGPDAKASGGSAVMLGAMLAKLLVLVAGAYVALVVWDLQTIGFVVGLCVGLVCLVGPILARLAWASGRRRWARNEARQG